MADLEAVSPLTLDLLASLAATDQLLAIVDPAGSPYLGRVPLSGLDARFALKDASNVTPATWRTALSAQGYVVPATAHNVAGLTAIGVLEDSGVLASDIIIEGDARLTDARTPVAHTQTASTITDFAAAVAALAQGVVLGATDNLASFDVDGFVQDSGIAVADVIQEGDARLTDARTPTSHTHPFSEITGEIDFSQFPTGSGLQFLRLNSTNDGLEWVSVPGGGDLLSTNNLSDVVDASEARQNLGVEIGVDVAPWGAMSDTFATLTDPGADRILFWDFSASTMEWLSLSANLAIGTTTLDVTSTVMLKADNLSGLANTGTARGNLGVAIGTDVQAHSTYLDFIHALGDVGADRILFWDESAGASGEWAALTVGTGLNLTTTTLTVDQSAIDHGSIAGLTDDDHTQYLLTTGLRDWDEQAGTPSTPATGKWKAYFKSDGLYFIDDAGAETGPLGTGGGGGSFDERDVWLLG